MGACCSLRGLGCVEFVAEPAQPFDYAGLVFGVDGQVAGVDQLQPAAHTDTQVELGGRRCSPFPSRAEFTLSVYSRQMQRRDGETERLRAFVEGSSVTLDDLDCRDGKGQTKGNNASAAPIGQSLAA